MAEPDVDEILREAREGIRRLQGKVKVKRKKKAKPIPGGSQELYPGGPSVDTGDIRLARVRRRKARRAAIAAIRQEVT